MSFEQIDLGERVAQKEQKPLVYLAGAIERSPDGGCYWREEISKFLVNELGHWVFNPCREEHHILTPEEANHFRSWKESDITKFRKTISKIIRNDLSILHNRADYIICYWDEYVLYGGGTHGELTFAFWFDIPVYMVTHIPLREMSSWIVGCTTEIFPNFDLLKNFLRERYA
ncbi:MAG: hypothetical protein Kow0042_20290 [Calditrichia bacterium]